MGSITFRYYVVQSTGLPLFSIEFNFPAIHFKNTHSLADPYTPIHTPLNPSSPCHRGRRSRGEQGRLNRLRSAAASDCNHLALIDSVLGKTVN